ncbi:endonuclease NucS domain-containing protein [Micromonospora chalcea]
MLQPSFLAAGRSLPCIGIVETVAGDATTTPLDELYRVGKMKFARAKGVVDRSTILYNHRATRLDLLERGLTLVALEYRLPNRAGTAGRIDILARDKTGCLVVIESKRTDSAAQAALHELAKYLELLQREKGIGPPDLRAMIVAVQWRELLVPFTKAARAAAGGLTGYQLVVASDMVTPVAAQRIAPLDEVSEPILSDQQLFIQSASRSFDDAWTWATARFGRLGIADLVGFEFSHTVYAPGLYLVLASRRPSDATRAMERWETAPNGFTVENGHPHSLISLHSDPSWTLGRVRRSGVYTDATLFRDEDLLIEASSGGLSDIKYAGTATSSYAPCWARLRSRIRRALSGNDAWTAAVERWMKSRR